MNALQEAQLAHLVFANRWAAMATVKDGKPFSSYVAYVPDVSDGVDGFLIHVSRLARHTTNLLESSFAAFSMSEADDGNGDPQTLVRVTLQGSVTVVGRDCEVYNDCREKYIQALPESQQLFSFADFVLFKFSVDQVRFVAGFGKSFTLSSDTLWRVGAKYPVGP
jgi:putative heme iron utilization protein